MRIALSTCWNSERHETGEALLDEIQSLGFDTVELGYALTHAQSDGVLRRVRSGSVKVCSVHAFCPNPVPDGGAGPEPFSLCDKRDFDGRRNGIAQVMASARFAAEAGASRLVLHAGRVPPFRAAAKLDKLVSDGWRAEHPERYDRKLARFSDRRSRKAKKPLETLYASLEEVLPQTRALGVTLCLENLPTADGCPDENELVQLLADFKGEGLAYWHDSGHGQRRQELGLIHHAGIVRRLAPHIAGFHLHDMLPPLQDHAMPPGGKVDFSMFRPFVDSDAPMVLEPRPARTAGEIVGAARHLSELFGLPPPPAPSHPDVRLE